MNTAISNISNINIKDVSSKRSTNSSSGSKKDKFSDIVRNAVKDSSSKNEVKNKMKNTGKTDESNETLEPSKSISETDDNKIDVTGEKSDSETSLKDLNKDVNDSAAAILMGIALVEESKVEAKTVETEKPQVAFENVSAVNNNLSENALVKTDADSVKVVEDKANILDLSSSKVETSKLFSSDKLFENASELENAKELDDTNKTEGKINFESVKTNASEDSQGTKLTIESGNERLDTKQDYDVNKNSTNGAFMPDLNVNTLSSDTVFVKVSDGKVINDKEAINDLADKIIHRSLDNAQEFNIQLNPKELGNLNIKVLFENGKAELSIICSNSKSYNLISNNLEALSSIIKTNTGNEVNINVQENSEYFNERQDLNQESSQHEKREQSSKNKKYDEQKALDFVQQLRIGLA